MRRFAPAAAAFITITATALISAPAQAYPPPWDLKDRPQAYGLTVQPNLWCEDDPTDDLCATEFTATTGWYMYDDDIVTSMKLKNLDTGQTLAVADPDAEKYDTKVSADLEGGLLPAGSYQLTLDWFEIEHWECSQYFHDGCRWMDDEFTVHWKFKYDGETPLEVRPWFAPWTKIANAQITPRGLARIAKGQVQAATERSDFTLNKAGWAARRQVLLQRSPNGVRWKTVATGRTNARGVFRLRTRVARPSAVFFWRVVVPATGNAPAKTLEYRRII